MRFRDRREAGQRLGEALAHLNARDDLVVLGLPRGGVPVAAEVARALRAPLDVFVVRKLGTPGQEELAMGALASGGTRVLNDEVVRALRIGPAAIAAATEQEQRELERREQLYRGSRPPAPVADRTVVVVDDGLATGSSMRAAVDALRQRRPRAIVVAVPVAAASTCRELGQEVDEVVCLSTPEPFLAVGQWYTDFSQTTDEEVRRLLVGASAPA